MSSQKKQIEEYSASDIESLLRELPPSALAELYELIGEGGPPPPSYTEFCQKTSIHTLDPWQVDMTTRLNDSMKAGGARIMIHKPPQHGGCIVEGELVSNSLGFLTPIEGVQVGSDVLGIDNKWQLKRNSVVAWVDSGEKDVVKVTLQSGRVVRMTPCHRVLTVQGWVPVGQLRPNDAIAAPRSIGHCMTGNLPDGYASLLGYLVGDGNVTNNALVITNIDKDVIKHVEDCASSAGWLAVHEPHKMRLRIVRKTRRAGREKSPFRVLSEYLDICTAPYKRVPSVVMNGSKEDVASFIGAYFVCDGYVGRSTSQSEYAEIYSSSEHLLRDVQLLLKRFGINATLRKKPYIKLPKKGANHDMWRLIIGGYDLVEFAKHIPVVGVKGEKLRTFAHYAGGKSHSHEYDAIPDGWKQMLEKSVTWHRYNSGIRADKRYKKGIARRVLQKLARADCYNNDILRLTNEDVIWERIKSIENDGLAQTYDIQTESDHNFTVNGVFVHNSHYLSQRLPAWVLGCDPAARVKICCYNIERAVEHGKVVTDIMKSPEYREIFPKCIIPKNTPQAMWSTLARKALMDGQPSFHCIGMESGFTGYGVDCLPGESVIETTDGRMTIRELHELEDKPLVWGVESIFKGMFDIIATRKMMSEKRLVDVEHDSGVLRCTEDHRVWVHGSFWVKAGELQPGQLLGRLDGSKSRVLGVSYVPYDGPHEVYDIQVKDAKNFFADGILVHNCLIIDDPYPDFQTALSESFNKSIELFWRGTVRPRLNKNTNVVVMYHRYTDWDFVSWLKDEADWTELRYPALCDDPDRDLMGRKEDEPLSPRYDYEWYCNERDKNPTYFAALYQGAPLPEGGGDIKTNFFNIIKEDAVPPMRTFCNREAENHLRLKILVADIAVSEKTRADWSVIMPVGVDSLGNYYIFRPWRKKSDWVETRNTMQNMATQHRVTRLVVEKAGQIGGLISNAREQLVGVTILSAETSKDKSVRQKEWAAELETGKIFLVNDTDEDSCDWIRDFLHECRGFPGGKHDDQVDCVGLAIGALRGFYSAESSKGDAKAIYRFKSG